MLTYPEYLSLVEANNRLDSLIDSATSEIVKAVEDFLKRNVSVASHSPSVLDRIKNKLSSWFRSPSSQGNPSLTPSYMKESVEIINCCMSINEAIANFDPLKQRISIIVKKLVNDIGQQPTVSPAVTPERNLESGSRVQPQNNDILGIIKKSPQQFLTKLAALNNDEKTELMRKVKKALENNGVKNTSYLKSWIDKLKNGIIVPFFQEFLDRYKSEVFTSPASRGHTRVVPEKHKMTPEEQDVLNRTVKSKGNAIPLIVGMLKNNVDYKDIIEKFPELEFKTKTLNWKLGL